MKKVAIYDNTLRDGEQTVGVCFSQADKTTIAKMLAASHIQRFEAGFAAVSKSEQDAIRAVVREVPNAEVFSLARLQADDVKAAHASRVQGVTLIAPASDAALRMAGSPSLGEIENRIQQTTKYARSLRLIVRFSCVDASRAPLSRLLRWYRLACKAGADVISFPDTAGAATPEKISSAVKILKSEIKLPLSIHCHNDLGMAVANSLAAAASGADEVQVAINGLGERAGNTPAEEFILAMKAGYGLDLGVDLKALMELSRFVIQTTGQEPAPNKPIIGKNVFCHESGLHVRGLLRSKRDTYAPFPPEWVGREHEVAFGKHSGRSNVRFHCQGRGIKLTDHEERELSLRIKQEAEKRKRGLTTKEVREMILARRHTAVV